MAVAALIHFTGAAATMLAQFFFLRVWSGVAFFLLDQVWSFRVRSIVFEFQRVAFYLFSFLFFFARKTCGVFGYGLGTSQVLQIGAHIIIHTNAESQQRFPCTHFTPPRYWSITVRIIRLLYQTKKWTREIRIAEQKGEFVGEILLFSFILF